jgi:hypothetical protein
MSSMARPVTLFTGQWASYPWPSWRPRPPVGVRRSRTREAADHFDVDRVLAKAGYAKRLRTGSRSMG